MADRGVKMKQKIDFDKNWRFCPEDLPPMKNTEGWGGAKARAYSFGVPSEEYDDSNWKLVDLPHDFVSEKEYCFKANENSEMKDIPEMESIGSRLFAGGCLEGSIAWYRKKFTTDISFADKRIYIHFDGVYRNSVLYINQYYVGTHTSGYTSFYYDITDFLNIGGENVIAMRVDSVEREGWWYEGGGIYRHVWLMVTDNLHVEPWGIAVQAEPDLNTMSAAIKIKANIANKYFEEKTVRVIAEIKNKDEYVISKANESITISEWDNTEIPIGLTLENIDLWELERPYLYSLTLKLFVDDVICDEDTVSFGIRKMQFDADRGFILNGKNIKVKGLCCHHDHAGVGIGIPDSVIEYRVMQMKRMGANAVRVSHYPASVDLLNICDRLGMLVFEETRRMSSAPEDIECLKAMVKRDRNHPSIFLWGIGNEEIFSQHRPETVRTTQTMKAEIRKLDPTRSITSAVVCWDGEQRYDNAEKYVDVTKNLDVMGFNYCPTAWDDYHSRMPKQPIIITESTANSGTRGCYNTDESTGQYYVHDTDNVNKVKNTRKAVKKDMGENEWKYFAERPYLAGIFLWTGFDYRGEPTPLQYPAVYSQFGIFDYCGFAKDNFYYYKSWWQDEDVLHVFPHWNHPDKIGRHIDVYCYSNMEQVELFVNNNSYGKKVLEKNWYLAWNNVLYEPGELKVVGYRNGKPVADNIVRTTDVPEQLRLRAYRERIRVGETAIINIDVLDKNSEIVPDANNEIYFDIGANGMLLGTGNGNPGDHDSEKMPVRCAFHGKCQLLVKAVQCGELPITASSDGLIRGTCKIMVDDALKY